MPSYFETGARIITLTACFKAGLIADIRFSCARTSKTDGLSLFTADVKCAPSAIVVKTLFFYLNPSNLT